MSLYARRGLVFLALLLEAAALSSCTKPTGTEMVLMRDGQTHLATDYYLPNSGGPAFPVVLARTTYNKDGLATTAIAHNTLGFAYVAQDTRGFYASEGTSNGWEDDGWGENQDGADTVDWILEQPWCNGYVGTEGASSLGITQGLLAGASMDVSAQIIGFASANFYGQTAYQGGVFRKNLIECWAPANGVAHVIDIFKAHPADDGFWDQYDTVNRASRVTAPGAHIGGWFDIFQQGTIDAFVARQYNGGPGAWGNQTMVIGPWAHGISRRVGDLRFPDNYDFDTVRLQRRFFEYWLQGEENGVMDEPPVWYYTMGDVDDRQAPGNEWRTAADWPPLPIVERRFYLGSDWTLATGLPRATAHERSFVYDPDDPCPTVGGQNLCLESGPMDQSGVSGRSDVLVFVTDPLPRPLEVTGRVRVELYVSSDAVDTDFTAKLVDVYPDGREILMLDSIKRLKFRNGFDVPDYLEPGETALVEIDLWSISLVFNTGHRIGLQVSSSNYPRFEINPNTGEDFPSDNGTRVAVNTVHMGLDHASALVLPLPDADEDLLPDYEEEGAGTDPAVGDTDQDGLTDAFEAGYDGDPATVDVFDAETNPEGRDLDPLDADTDGDGVADGDELAAGTNPLEAAS